MRALPKALLLGALVAATAGCGTARVHRDGSLASAGSYRSAYVEPVEVRSKEETPRALELNDEIALLAYGHIQAAISRGARYELLRERTEDAGTLVVSTRIDVTYGSRALRSIVPGAGAGSVTSTMEVLDAPTKRVILRTVSESTLAGGVYGGSMDSTIFENVRALVEKSGLGAPQR